MKIIFVASDFSGLGKGTFSASLGRVLKSCDVDVHIMKCDLYFNYDAGTINPGEHGEVYVLADGTEVDQDFGIYERFLGIEASSRDYMTSGQVFHQIYLNERAGNYLGQTVSVEHVIDEIKNRMTEFASRYEVAIIELGATIGDIKGTYFLEACRQLMAGYDGVDKSLFILLSHFPYLENVHELKTMGCQRSVNDLRAKGIKPNIIVARTSNENEIPDSQLRKIEMFCGVSKDSVITVPDLANELQLPQYISEKGLQDQIAKILEINLEMNKLKRWYRNHAPSNDLKIALVGKYAHADAYVSIIQQLKFLGVRSVTFLSRPKDLTSYDAVILPGGWGERGIENIIKAAKVCREEQIPCLGICLGLQIMVIEYARNVLGLENANSAEFDPTSKNQVVILQEDQKKRHALGGTSRLGNWTTILSGGSCVASIYKKTEIVQRHRHRYEITSDIDFGDFRVIGRDQRTGLIEVMELSHHPFYIGVQYHPEMSIDVPLFRALIETAEKRKRMKMSKKKQSHSSPHPLSQYQGTFLHNIDMNEEYRLREVAAMPSELATRQGIPERQHELLRQFFNVLDEQHATMTKIENEIAANEEQMRQINLNPDRLQDRLDGSPLMEEELLRLAELESTIKEKVQLMRNLRDKYATLLMQFDEAIGELEVD